MDEFDVVVIGGGMTAVDAAVQARLLGAENVSIVYRRGQDRMGASRHEQDHATASGVRRLATPCISSVIRVVSCSTSSSGASNTSSSWI